MAEPISEEVIGFSIDGSRSKDDCMHTHTHAKFNIYS